jgi:hypothetical protein
VKEEFYTIASFRASALALANAQYAAKELEEMATLFLLLHDFQARRPFPRPGFAN